MKSSLPMQSGITIVIIWSLLLGSLVPPDARRNDPSVAINRLETYLWKHLLLIPSLIETEKLSDGSGLKYETNSNKKSYSWQMNLSQRLSGSVSFRPKSSHLDTNENLLSRDKDAQLFLAPSQFLGLVGLSDTSTFTLWLCWVKKNTKNGIQ